MNLLLDTHVLLWWLDDSPRLSTTAREAIAEGDNVVFVSAATIWEIVIKQALGKLDLPEAFEEVLTGQPFRWLDISVRHAFEVKTLPLHHRDPFDRMLLAQCRVEGLTLVTADAFLNGYEIPVLPA